MSRFSPCRSLTLEGVCRDCACDCAMRSHSLMRVTGGDPLVGECFDIFDQPLPQLGVNILSDPSFEIQPTEYPAGPNNTHLPYVNQSDNLIYWVSFAFTPPGLHPGHWIHPPASGGNTNYLPTLGTNNPRTGTHNYTLFNGTGTVLIGNYTTPVGGFGGYDCSGLYTIGNAFPFTCKAPTPGTILTFKAYIALSSGTCSIQSRIGWIRESPGYIGDFDDVTFTSVSGSSYTEYTLLNYVVPADRPATLPPDLIRIDFRPTSVPAGATIDMDDFSLVFT